VGIASFFSFDDQWIATSGNRMDNGKISIRIIVTTQRAIDPASTWLLEPLQFTIISRIKANVF